MKKLQTWVIYALIGFIGYFFVNFLLKMVSSENPLIITLVLFVSAAGALFLFLVPRKEFSISRRGLVLAMVIGILAVVATALSVMSINLAPNPGYSVAIRSAYFLPLALVSVVAFRSPLTPLKFLGIVATLIGLILLSI